MRIKVGAILIALALLALVYGSAALTTVTVKRTFNAETLKLNSDVDNGVVRIVTLVTKKDTVYSDLSQALPKKPTGFPPSVVNGDDNSESPNTYEPLPTIIKDIVVPLDIKPVFPNKPSSLVPPPNTKVAVKLEALDTYKPLLTTDKDGVVSFDLSQALLNGTVGLNPNAQFTIGSADAGVFRITNNSNTSIKVSLEAGEYGGLALKDSIGGTSSIIDSGAAQTFYFEIDTTGILAGNAINGILLIREI